METSYESSLHPKKNKGPSVSQFEYVKIIEGGLFLMNYTELNIACAISVLSRYTHNSSKEHWDALFWLLKYLKDTVYWSLLFNKFPDVLEGFYDANCLW